MGNLSNRFKNQDGSFAHPEGRPERQRARDGRKAAAAEPEVLDAARQAQLEAENASLRNDVAHLRGEIEKRDMVIAQLRKESSATSAPVAESPEVADQKPWQAMGISRTKYYRMLREKT